MKNILKTGFHMEMDDGNETFINIIVMDDKWFDYFLDVLESSGVERGDDTVVDNIAICLNDNEYIVIRGEQIMKLDEDERTILLAHEVAHLQGIEDEEDADYMALNFLNRKRQEMLMEEWAERNGREFEDYLIEKMVFEEE